MIDYMFKSSAFGNNKISKLIEERDKRIKARSVIQ
jgi:hypothetical protein